MAPRPRPPGYGDISSAGTNLYPDAEVPESVQGFPDLAIPPARKFNRLAFNWSQWIGHLDSLAPRSIWLFGSNTFRLSGNQFNYDIGAGLSQDIGSDSSYVLGGYVVDLPMSRIVASGLSPFSFAPNRWTHFYVDQAGAILTAVVVIGTPAAPPVGYYHLGTMETDALDCVQWYGSSNTDLATRRIITDAPWNFTATNATIVTATMGTSSGTGFLAPLTNGANQRGFYSTMAASVASARGFHVLMTDVASAGTGFRCDALGTGPAFYAAHTGAGDGLAVVHSGTGSGVSIVQSGGGYALSVDGGPTVEAARFAAGAGQIAGVFSTVTGIASITASGGSTAAMWGQGVGGGFGGRFDAGPTATAGGQGTGASTTAHGLHGRTAVNAGASAAGVFGEGRGTASIGVLGRADNGIGVIAQGDAGSPAYPAMVLVPQDADPSAYTFDGALIWHSSHRTLRHCVAGYGYRSVLSYGPGSAVHVVSQQAAGATATDNAGIFSTVLSVTCDESKGQGLYGSDLGAQVLIRFSCDARSAGAAEYLRLRIVDQTTVPATTLATWTGSGSGALAGFALPNASSDWQRHAFIEFMYSFPVDGTRSFRVEFARQTNSVTIRNAVLDVCGTF